MVGTRTDYNVCADCGLEAVVRPDGTALHVEEPPDGWKTHDVGPIITRSEYLFGRQEVVSRSPSERQTMALERQAAALERIATVLERSGTT